MIDEIINTQVEKFNNVLEEKIKECCELWLVDINNHKELKERCVLEYNTPFFNEYDTVNRILIDGNLVMVFTNWEIDNANLDSFKINASLKCSEIIKPSQYQLEKIKNDYNKH